MKRTLSLFLALSLLSACDVAPSSPEQRVDLSNIPAPSNVPPLESPDTSDASWRVDENGRAIRFGNEGEAPLMSLACLLSDAPPQMVIMRHAPAQPRQKALFPVIGNGMRSRFLVDAGLYEGEWRWEGTLPASDPQLDVFTGTRDMTATLPGGGMLEISGSRLPGEFVSWCRAGGQTPVLTNPIAE